MANQAEAFAMIMEAKNNNGEAQSRTRDLKNDIFPRLTQELDERKQEIGVTIELFQNVLDLVRSADETGHFEESQNIHRYGDNARNQCELILGALTEMMNTVGACQNAINEADSATDWIGEELDKLLEKLAG